MNHMNSNLVAALTDHHLDKYSLLERALEKSRFFEVLEENLKRSGKDKKDFRIAVKPNLSMMLRRSDVGTYTDPFLVIHLLRLLLKRGYENLAVVESQNLYGNWFENRAVVQVAARAGFFEESVIASYRGEKSHSLRVKGDGVDAPVPLIDMTLDAIPHDFGEPVGEVLVGRAWVEADFRISFPKMKTHFYCLYSLAVKNIYGCLPLQDKVREYHCRRATALWTAHLIKAFPVHFSIADAYTGADGILGVKIRAICKKPHTMIAGADIMAVDRVGTSLIKVKPERSSLFSNLAKLCDEKPYRVEGNAAPFKPWVNPPYFMAIACKIIESNANIMDFMGALATGGYDPCFPHAKPSRGLFKKILYYLTLPVNLMMDLGIVKLRVREAMVKRRLKKQKDKIPVISGSDFLISRLAFFSGEDLKRLIEIMEQRPAGEVSFSGHYLFFGGREFPFPARLSTTTLAAFEVVSHARERGLEPGALAGELRRVLELFPDLWGSGEKYPYCYR